MAVLRLGPERRSARTSGAARSSLSSTRSIGTVSALECSRTMRSIRPVSRYSLEASFRCRTTRVPWPGASSCARGAIENVPLPSELQCERLARTRAPGDDVDVVGHHEGRIKSDPELADQIEWFSRPSATSAGLAAALRGPSTVEKCPRSGPRDRAELIGEIV